MNRVRPCKLGWITVAIFVVIVYGSLYPFDFFFHGDDPFRALWATRFQLTSRGDILSNVLLYLPFGFFAVQSLGAKSLISDDRLYVLRGGYAFRRH